MVVLLSDEEEEQIPARRWVVRACSYADGRLPSWAHGGRLILRGPLRLLDADLEHLRIFAAAAGVRLCRSEGPADGVMEDVVIEVGGRKRLRRRSAQPTVRPA